MELGVCEKFKCESFEVCEKCVQNLWEGTNAQLQQICGGSYHSKGRQPQSETIMLWQIQLQNA